jgi:branched-chain amino acid transport system ATP-binding protein
MDKNTLLEVEHLSMKFGGLMAINDLSFNAYEGEITALIGPNGAGKTTVFNCITGFYKPTMGMIRFASQRQESLPARADAGFQDHGACQGRPDIPEHPAVLRYDRAGKPAGGPAQQADEGVGLHPARPSGLGPYAKESKAIELARFWLDKINLTDRADDPAGDLPYGAQRRLEIARAMCTEPGCCASTNPRPASIRANRRH